MPSGISLAFGTFPDSFSVTSLKSYLAEFISTIIFVFAGVGSAVAYDKLSAEGSGLDAAGLVAIAICHGFALFVAVSISANISGGHVNPAVSLGLSFVGGITFLTSVFYTFAQVLGAIVACYLLEFTTGTSALPTHGLGAGVGSLQGLVMEIIITFGLVYTVLATAADPKKGSLGIIAPLAIGLIVGANILAAGPFSGGSMNPARSMGPAVVSGNMDGLWIYWTGPMLGGTLAGLVYGFFYINRDHEPLPRDEF